jgi:hypothetical protein
MDDKTHDNICPTQLDSDGIAVLKKGKWGTCGPGCPIGNSAAMKIYYKRKDECKNRAIDILTQG